MRFGYAALNHLDIRDSNHMFTDLPLGMHPDQLACSESRTARSPCKRMHCCSQNGLRDTDENPVVPPFICHVRDVLFMYRLL